MKATIQSHRTLCVKAPNHRQSHFKILLYSDGLYVEQLSSSWDTLIGRIICECDSFLSRSQRDVVNLIRGNYESKTYI